MKVAGNGHEGAQRIGDPDHRQAVGGKGKRHDRGRGVRFVQERRVLVIFHKGDVAAAGFLERACGRNDQTTVAAQLSVNQFRQRPQSDCHGPTSFLP